MRMSLKREGQRTRACASHGMQDTSCSHIEQSRCGKQMMMEFQQSAEEDEDDDNNAKYEEDDGGKVNFLAAHRVSDTG